MICRALSFYAAEAAIYFSAVCSPLGAGESSIDFNRDIRPLLSENCYECHGPDSAAREADLRFDREESAKGDRGGYFVISPGEVDASELVSRITSDDESMRMPPPESKKNLTAKQIDLLKRWIAEGAPWSPAWSYVEPRWWEVPNVTHADWPRNWIDSFVLARLESEGLSPSERADPVTLVRRLSFDLTGLPPSPETVRAYVANPTEDAYEKLVDKLLASPHYGERMAQMWLDLVRFADTVGYHGDQTHNIWPYRDYVIYSFNENMPFDQFTREQLAGDLLPDCTEDQLVASGCNRLLQTSHEGGVQLKEYRAIYLADRVRNVSQVWMGATMGCAQCHDHKYDPYTTRDFYSMGAFFADVDDEDHLLHGADSSPTTRKPEMEVLGIYQRQHLEHLEQQIANAEAAGDTEQADRLRAEYEKLSADKSLTMYTRAIKPRIVRVLARGNWQDESGGIVAPAVPEFLGKVKCNGERATRLDLAHWLTNGQGGAGGLTARVMVNRYWALLFGEGLARVLDDFGGQGEAPSHPQLLDNLAVEYLRSGWDTKHVLKLIVLSNAYRQTSAVGTELRKRDPLNILLARQNRFRLPAEMVRDTTLFVSGLLVDEIGGRSVKPFQPAGYYRHLNFPKRKYVQDTGPQQWRRGVYMHWQRQFLHPMLKAFDAPSREECTARRPRSNTALAALVLLNDPNSVEAARAFAAKILARDAEATDLERIAYAYYLAVSRTPDDREQQLLCTLLEESRSYYSTNSSAAQNLLHVGMAQIDSDAPGAELAAWTNVSRAILNMSETTTRN